jgi:signal transduction histidine kinase
MREAPYRFSRARAERTIAATRVAVAAFSLYAIWLDPAEPARFTQLSYALHIGYILYSIALAAVMWRRPSTGWLPVATHVADIFAFSVFQYLTLGPSSPFFTYFIFSLFCGAVRWGWKGALATAPAVVLAFIIIAASMSATFGPAEFEVNRFIIRIGYLLVVTVLLVYLGRHEARLRDEIRSLAGWPTAVGADAGGVIERVIAHAAGIVAAGRVVAIWEPDQEPRVQLAVWTPTEFHLTQQASAAFEPWVPEELAGESFLCVQPLEEAATVMTSRGKSLRSWAGEPLHGAVAAQVGRTDLVSAPFHTERVSGRVFFSELAMPTVELLPLVEVVAREIGASIDQREIHDRSRQVAIGEERIRVARDLHDGVLQSLTGMRFELQSLATQLREDSLEETRERLLAIERALAMEQRELRFFIEALQPMRPAIRAGADLATRLDELKDQIASQWQTPITVRFTGQSAALPPDIEEAVPRMVHEAVVNALKHGGPSRVSVTLESHHDGLRVVVADDGRGFPFIGHYDHATLVQRNLGPVSLRERVASLGGQVSVESSASGSKVEIHLPLPAHA